MPGGTPYGSASGKLHENQPRMLRRLYTLPTSLTAVADYEARHLIMAVLGLADPEVTCVATANPSTLTRLLAVIDQHAETILAAVADGRLPAELAALLDPDGGTGLEPRPERAAQLERRLDRAGRLTYADIWPALAGVVTWTGGSCAVAAANLEPSLPESCLVIEVGWVASEMQGTTNVDAASNTCLPVLGDTFFEFAEREAWDAGDAEMGAASSRWTRDASPLRVGRRRPQPGRRGAGRQPGRAEVGTSVVPVAHRRGEAVP